MIVSNKAMCEKCHTVIESMTVHDYVSCACRAIFVDGGKEYLRRGADSWKNFKELSVEIKEE